MEHISKFLEKHKVNVECQCESKNKYKVELKQVDTYTIDVLAKDEEEAKAIATEKWNEVCNNGTYHYHQEGDTENYISYVYDVTGTDDPFDALNN